MTNGRSIESEHRRWLYTPEAHVTKCQHGSNPDLCIACAHAITEGQAMTDIPVDSRLPELLREVITAMRTYAPGYPGYAWHAEIAGYLRELQQARLQLTARDEALQGVRDYLTQSVQFSSEEDQGALRIIKADCRGAVALIDRTLRGAI